LTLLKLEYVLLELYIIFHQKHNLQIKLIDNH